MKRPVKRKPKKMRLRVPWPRVRNSFHNHVVYSDVYNLRITAGCSTKEAASFSVAPYPAERKGAEPGEGNITMGVSLLFENARKFTAKILSHPKQAEDEAQIHAYDCASTYAKALNAMAFQALSEERERMIGNVRSSFECFFEKHESFVSVVAEGTEVRICKSEAEKRALLTKYLPGGDWQDMLKHVQSNYQSCDEALRTVCRNNASLLEEFNCVLLKVRMNCPLLEEDSNYYVDGYSKELLEKAEGFGAQFHEDFQEYCTEQENFSKFLKYPNDKQMSCARENSCQGVLEYTSNALKKISSSYSACRQRFDDLQTHVHELESARKERNSKVWQDI